MAQRLIVANSKGGVGKSTTVINIATELAAAGDKVLCVDIDRQQTTTWMAEHLANLGVEAPWDVATEENPDILARLGEVTQYDTVVVDSPGHLQDTEPLRAAVAASDYVIVPCGLSVFDLRGTLAALETIIKPSGVPYRILLTKTNARWPQSTEKYRDAFEKAGHPVFRATIRELEIFKRSMEEGRLVGMTKDRDSRAAREDYAAVAAEYLAETARMMRQQARR